MRIRRPKKKPSDIEYKNECEEMLAPAFNDLADLAEQRGWDCNTVALALESLARSNRKFRRMDNYLGPAMRTAIMTRGNEHNLDIVERKTN